MLLYLDQHPLGYAGGGLVVAPELHTEGGPTLGQGPKGRGVAKELRQRDTGANVLRPALAFHVLYATALPVEVPQHFAQELSRGHDLQLHDGLQQDGPAAPQTILQGYGCRGFEGQLGGVNRVEAAIHQSY